MNNVIIYQKLVCLMMLNFRLKLIKRIAADPFSLFHIILRKILSPFRSFASELLIYFVGFEEIPVNSTRIGHFLPELDCFFKEQILFRIPKKRYLLFYDSNVNYANPYFFQFLCNKSGIASLYKEQVSFELVDVSCLNPFIGFLRRHNLLRSRKLIRHFYSYVVAINETATCFEINSLWGSKPSLFIQPDEFSDIRRRFFDEIGLNNSKPYVLVHSREGGYSPNDENFHALRNVDFSSFSLAITALVSLGLNVIRMGDSSMSPSCSHDGFYDYALSKYKSYEMDFVLGSGALYFLGTASGAPCLSSIFGIPLAICNLSLPFSYSPLGSSRDIGIPKLVGCKETHCILPFERVFRERISEWRIPSDFEGSSYYLIPNSPEEIRDLAVEMYQRIVGEFIDDKFDERLQATFSNHIKPSSYTYGSASRCSSVFMRKYSHLILA